MNKEQGYRHPLAKRVLQFIKRHQLVLPRQTVLVAVSGGQDSVCLLSILIKLQKELDINIHVCHLNHQLRGADSEADARYVNDLADRFGVPVIIESRDVKSYQAKQRISLEEAAREVRYNFFAEVAAAINADCVAVGHTVDDHIETFLMHLIRGSGTRGLRGLQPAGSWRPSTARLVIIRPLLPLSRRETAD